MEMTNKFLLYDLNQGGFIGEKGNIQDNDIAHASMFSKESAEKTVQSVDETSFLEIPLTQGFVDCLPFELADTAPEMAHSALMDLDAAKEGDFVVLTEYGFYDEKYNPSTNSSRPKIRSFQLDYANLYNMEKLEELHAEWITMPSSDMGADPIIVPVSETQQEKLRAIPEFAEEKGFFFEPIGDTQRMNPKQNEELPDLASSLETLENEQAAADLPWKL